MLSSVTKLTSCLFEANKYIAAKLNYKSNAVGL